MFSGPVATQFHLLNNEEMAMKGASPAPTHAPRMRSSVNLFERQDVVSRGIETCGFVSGNWSKKNLFKYPYVFACRRHVLGIRLVFKNHT